MEYQNHSFDHGHHDSGGFLLGLLSGVVLGVGVGMLMAPRSGSEMRETIAQSASELQRRASQSLGQVSHKVRETTDQVGSRVKDAADRGRDVMNKAKEGWNEVRQDVQSVPGPSTTPSAGGSYVS